MSEKTSAPYLRARILLLLSDNNKMEMTVERVRFALGLSANPKNKARVQCALRDLRRRGLIYKSHAIEKNWAVYRLVTTNRKDNICNP